MPLIVTAMAVVMSPMPIELISAEPKPTPVKMPL